MPQAIPVPAAATEPIRVMVVDDAVVFRGFVTRWLSEEPDMSLVGSHRNGHEAIANLKRADPDVVVLDIEMPELDGLATLPLLLAKKPGLIVLIVSTVTRRNAEVGIRALTLGAADYVGKPEPNREVSGSNEFRRQLIEKIRGLGRRRSRTSAPGAPAPLPAAGISGGKEQRFELRPYAMFPRVLAIGSSTGGPQALQSILQGLNPILRRVPVLITQHMPSTFTAILAEHLGRVSGLPAHEAVHGENLAAGTLYVAPGGRHMTVERTDAGARIALDDGPPLHFCKPAVDPLFASAAAAFGAGTLALLLTGMGVDGADGASKIAAAGGSVIAQDEATSVVWGMPGTAAQAGYCSGVLPLDEIAPRVASLIAGDKA